MSLICTIKQNVPHVNRIFINWPNGRSERFILLIVHNLFYNLTKVPLSPGLFHQILIDI
jgi:hypothetical protein